MQKEKKHNELDEKYCSKVELKNGKVLVMRVPKEDDALQLMNHLKQVDTETKFLGREPDEFNFTLEQEKEFIKGFDKDENSLFLVGEIDDEVIANVSVSIVRNNRRFLHRAAFGITVQKKHWRSGIGKLLIEKVIDWCKDKGVEQLELEVVSDNERAVELYKSQGFVKHGTMKNAIKYADNTYADEDIMILFMNKI